VVAARSDHPIRLVVIRSHKGSAIVPTAHGAEGVVVAYEADMIDPTDHVGWSVIVTGPARLVTDPEETARYRGSLRPWVAGEMDYVIQIRPELVTGFRLTGGDAAASPDL
jgi:Pyridoxamine 5'-phosphate oxidase